MGDKKDKDGLFGLIGKALVAGRPVLGCPSCRSGRCDALVPMPNRAVVERRPESETQPGALDWWCCGNPWKLRGPVDATLRLLEQRKLTRAKAREMLDLLVHGRYDNTISAAPWSELNWCQEDDDG